MNNLLENNPIEQFKVIVIGAGAAGLMCAITAAKRGRSVLVLDHSNKVGKKILMSGGGRCNFTNYSIEPENFICSNPHFCKSALSRYTQWQFIELVEKYDIGYYDKGLGQLFCTKSSKDIRNMLVAECERYGVSIQLQTKVTSILPAKNKENTTKLHVKTKQIDYLTQSVVIATGGLSIPTMGATGFGYEIAKQYGHNLIATRPSLTPLTFDKKWLDKTARLPGNAISVEVKCCDTFDNEISFREAMLFTHKGLSGPAILQISNYWQPGKPLFINLLPEIDTFAWISRNKTKRPEINLKTLLSSEFSQSVAEYFCELIGLNSKLKHLEHNEISGISDFLSNWEAYPAGYEGYRVAEVTFAGVDTSEISSKTFESSRQNGLFFIGEVLDVTGHLGGYNFQWAWSSGNAAGQYV